MGAPRIKDEVLRYIARHPGVSVWRKDIANDLNLTESQVTQAVGSALRSTVGEASTHVVVIEQGRAWRWSETPVKDVDSQPKPGMPRLFEEITTLPDGRILVKGDDSNVYWLTAI